MPIQPLPLIPDKSNVFIDANIFIYGLNGQSAQCKRLLERCSREEVTGICLFEIVNEATHRFMLAEALERKLILNYSVSALRKHFDVIRNLTAYWQNTQRILNLNL